MKQAKDLKVLMISLDAGLLGQAGAGDTRERHIKYAAGVHSLDIILLGGSTDRAVKIADNCTVYQTGAKGLRGYLKGFNLGKKICSEKQIDIIDTQDPHATGRIGLKLKQQFKIPLEVHFHGDFWGNKAWLSESWKNRLFSYWQKKVAPQADGLRVVSPAIAEQLRQSGLAADKIRVISTPVNMSVFAEAEAQPQSGPALLLFVGRLVEAKNLFFMLEVIKSLWQERQDFRVKIIGDGYLRDKLAVDIKEKRLEQAVELAGTRAPEELVAEYSRARALLLFSTNESFGKVIVEAGAAGLATIAAESVGPASIITNGRTGLLVGIDNQKASLEAINKVLDQPQLLTVIGPRPDDNLMSAVPHPVSRHSCCRHRCSRIRSRV